MKRKNIAKSVVLGLMLASIGNCVWAEEDNTRVFHGDKVFNETLGGLWGSKDDVKVVDGSLTINITDKSFNDSWEDDGTHNVSLNVSKNIDINTSLSQSNGYSASIDVTKNTEIISGGDINITSNNSHANPSYGIISTYLNSKANITAIGNLNIKTTNIGGYNYGLNVNYGIMNVNAKDIFIDTESNTMNIAIQAMESGSIVLKAKGNVDVISKGNNSYGIWSYGNKQLGSTNVKVDTLYNVSIASGKTAILAQNGGTVNIDSNTSHIQSKNGTAISVDSGSQISLITKTGNNEVHGKTYGVYSQATGSTAKLDSKDSNNVSGDYAVNAYNQGEAELKAVNNNIVKSEINGVVAKREGSKVTLLAEKGSNQIFSSKKHSVWGSKSTITLTAEKGMNLIVNENGTIGEDFNAVYNDAAIIDLNGLKNVVAAGKITHSNTNGFDAWFGNKTAVFAKKEPK